MLSESLRQLWQKIIISWVMSLIVTDITQIVYVYIFLIFYF